MAGGYVLLHRKLIENPIWTAMTPAVLKLMIGFLLSANWAPRKWYDGTREVEIPRGSFVTSYPKMAEFCGLSLKQTRAGFMHLERAGFAAYSRAPKYTIVNVLNYEAYQSTESEQGRVEGILEGRQRAGRRAPTKEIKNINTPPTPSPEGELFNLNQLSLGEVKPVTKAVNQRNGTEHQAILAAVASAIHARHPSDWDRRDCGVGTVEKLLTAILKHKRIPSDQRDAYLRRIDANHASLCASEQWCKDDRMYAKALSNWLAPTKERYDVEGPTNRGNDAAPRLLA